jgi:putative DNA primase/helicase
MTEVALSSSAAAELIKAKLKAISTGGADESKLCLELGELHSFAWVPVAVAKALELRKAVVTPKAEIATEVANRGEAITKALEKPSLADLLKNAKAKSADQLEEVDLNEEELAHGEAEEFDLSDEEEEQLEFKFTEAPLVPGVLDPKAPLDNARMFVSLRYWHRPTNTRTLQFWQNQFWEWNGLHWKVVDDNSVRAKVYRFLDQAEKEPKAGYRTRFEPGSTDVNKTVDALRAECNLAPEHEMPGWLYGAAPVENLRELVACQNGLLNVRTRELIPHTPLFWSPNVLEFSYNPDAVAPRFAQFLEEIFPKDSEAQQSLKEMYGLCLTDETKFQKAFMFVGPKRGGRGTIGRVLQGLIGKENYIGSTLGAFGTDFGMQSFIGKKVVVFSDARLDGVRRDRLSTIAERFLSITGEDPMDINRKYLGYWNGRLSCRLAIFSNELLRFQDDSGALAGRFITYRMSQTFYGREDPDLTAKLLAERPGIMNLALDALDELRSRGKLLQPASGTEMAESLASLSSDIGGFVEERCEIDPDKKIGCDALFKVWQLWCAKRNVRYGWGTNQFSEKLRSVVPSVRTSRPRSGGPSRPVVLVGIGLRT